MSVAYVLLYNEIIKLQFSLVLVRLIYFMQKVL